MPVEKVSLWTCEICGSTGKRALPTLLEPQNYHLTPPINFVEIVHGTDTEITSLEIDIWCTNCLHRAVTILGNELK